MKFLRGDFKCVFCNIAWSQAKLLRYFPVEWCHENRTKIANIFQAQKLHSCLVFRNTASHCLVSRTDVASAGATSRSWTLTAMWWACSTSVYAWSCAQPCWVRWWWAAWWTLRWRESRRMICTWRYVDSAFSYTSLRCTHPRITNIVASVAIFDAKSSSFFVHWLLIPTVIAYM